MHKIRIDGNEHQVRGEKNLLEVILSLGYDLPYFCWHPALGSVGSCRQCAIRKYTDDEDVEGKIVMSCMEPVADNLRLSIEEEGVRQFRKNVIEWLMVNHPHDCPICDEGGECHLQDMTVMAGHTYRRFRHKKRTYNNQDLGPCINHEMNRCIQCYRCVRFYDDYAGGNDLQVFAAHDHVYFGRHQDGTLESEFSGNLVEVCPTGVFTDKTLKEHYTRKWDLTSAPSVCHHCSLGCNILASERYGSLRRILSRYNGEVNGYFICDRGRFGYDFVNDEGRLRSATDKNDDTWPFVGAYEAVNRVGKMLKEGKAMGIGSPRASLESNFALRALTGEANFYNGSSARENALSQLALDFMRNGAVRTPSLKEIEQYDAVIIIGEDVTNTAPMIDLAVRQSVLRQPKKRVKKAGIPLWNDAATREHIQDDRGPLFILTPQKTKLGRIATASFRDTPESLAHLVNAIAHRLDDTMDAPASPEYNTDESVDAIASALANAARPLVITGTSLGHEGLMKSAINLASALHKANQHTGISFVFQECNTLGVAMMEKNGLQEALEAAGDHEVLCILENNLFRRLSSESAREFLGKFRHVVVLDHMHHETTVTGDILLPAGTFAEAEGTLINNEGRAQRFFQVQEADVGVRASWRWIIGIGRVTGQEKVAAWHNLDDIIRDIESELQHFKGISGSAPPADYRIADQRIARAPHRYSGRTAMFANHAVSEPKPPLDENSPLSFTMEGYHGKPPAATVPFYWAPGWNSVQSINKFQIEVGGPMHDMDPGVRLIEPSGERRAAYYPDSPDDTDVKNKWKLIPVHHIFGSDMLSMKSRAIVQRSPGALLTMNAEEAQELDIADGAQVTITGDGLELSLPAKLDAQWPRGRLGVPVGFPDVPYFDTDILVELKRERR